MMQHGLTTQTRPAPLSHKPWTPHAYQLRAVQFLLQSGAAALWMSPGLGKTSVVLSAFNQLASTGLAKRALVIAPLRVCQTVWRQEAAKWSEFRHLKFCLIHGPKKEELLRNALKSDTQVFLINPEGVQWLTSMYAGRPLPFDTLVVDELTKFKNSSAERHKTLRPRVRGIMRRWGLTGTPAPNGYMDLFGQFLLLDEGAALGKYITHYRENYFQVGFDGWTYELQPGGAKRIEKRLEPYVLTMMDQDYLALPPLVPHVIPLEMAPAARKLYTRMKNDAIAALPGGIVTGANAAAVYAKLKQMTNGAVYTGPDAADVIHDTKLEALDELLEELDGEQLLLSYEFNHDKARLAEHFGARITFFEGNEKKTQEINDAWNRGEIKFLACHPASAAHGLNLQYSNCAHVCWFSPIWDFELFDQFIRRIRRQGNQAQRIINHILVMKDSIDEIALQALSDKDTTQGRLVKALNSEILRDGEAPTSGEELERHERLSNMVLKLGRQSDPQPAAPPPGVTTQPNGHVSTGALPAGWGNGGETAQRERVSAVLQGQDPGVNPNQAKALSAFSAGVQAAHTAIAQPAAPVPQHIAAPRGEADRMAAEVDAAADIAKPSGRKPRAVKAETAQPFKASHEIRLGVLSEALKATDGGTLDEALEVAKELLAFVEGE